MSYLIPNLHPMAVHFPIALATLAALFHAAALLTRDKPACATHCSVMAHTTLWLAALAAAESAIHGHVHGHANARPIRKSCPGRKTLMAMRMRTTSPSDDG